MSCHWRMPYTAPPCLVNSLCRESGPGRRALYCPLAGGIRRRRRSRPNCPPTRRPWLSPSSARSPSAASPGPPACRNRWAWWRGPWRRPRRPSRRMPWRRISAAAAPGKNACHPSWKPSSPSAAPAMWPGDMWGFEASGRVDPNTPLRGLCRSELARDLNGRTSRHRPIASKLAPAGTPPNGFPRRLGVSNRVLRYSEPYQSRHQPVGRDLSRRLLPGIRPASAFLCVPWRLCGEVLNLRWVIVLSIRPQLARRRGLVR